MTLAALQRLLERQSLYIYVQLISMGRYMNEAAVINISSFKSWCRQTIFFFLIHKNVIENFLQIQTFIALSLIHTFNNWFYMMTPFYFIFHYQLPMENSNRLIDITDDSE